MCFVDTLPYGLHTLVVNVTRTPNPFLFDYLVLPFNASKPDPLTSAKAVDVRLNFDNKRLIPSGNWSPIDPGMVTGEVGSSLSLNFTGDFFRDILTFKLGAYSHPFIQERVSAG